MGMMASNRGGFSVHCVSCVQDGGLLCKGSSAAILGYNKEDSQRAGWLGVDQPLLSSEDW
jgi:hypothetical protein